MQYDAIKQNIIDMWRDLAKTKLVNFYEHNNVLIECVDMKDPLFNYIIETEDDENIHLSSVYHRNNQSHYWWVNEDSEKIKRLCQAGYTYASGLLGLRYELGNSNPYEPTFNIHFIDEIKEISHWAQVIKECFQLCATDSIAFSKIIQRSLLQPDKFFHFAVKLDKKIVATLTLYINNKVGGIYNGATLPQFRHRGMLTALVLYAHQVARNHGCRCLMAQAGPHSCRLLISMGYRQFTRYSLFISNPRALNKRWIQQE